MPASSPSLRDYRDKLTFGIVLGLGYAYYDSAYLAIRGTQPTRYTVAKVTDAS